MTETAIVGTDADFTRTITINAAQAALRAAITTAEGVSGWWAQSIRPSPPELNRPPFLPLMEI